MIKFRVQTEVNKKYYDRDILLYPECVEKDREFQTKLKNLQNTAAIFGEMKICTYLLQQGNSFKVCL